MGTSVVYYVIKQLRYYGSLSFEVGVNFPKFIVVTVVGNQ